MRHWLFISIGFFLISQSAFSHHTVLETPTKRLSSSEYPAFSDDLDFVNMNQALDRQIVRFRQRSLSGQVKYGNDLYPESHLLTTLLEFKKDVAQVASCLSKVKTKAACFMRFDQIISEKYNVYAPNLTREDPRYGEEKDTFFTAYYTPTLEGSMTRSERYPHGVYRKPTEKSLSELGRIDIDFRKRLKDTDYGVFFTDDFFQLYLLQVQGGGKVVLENGESFYISYDGTNGQSWNWISIYMRDQGYIPDLSIEAQRKFLDENPEKQEEVYSVCPSYVFFKPTEHPPEGSDLVSLTDGRSIATDSKLYRRKGALAFVKAKRPDPRREGNHYIEFSRFMLDQDTGGAIKGKGRVDLYHGEDAYAERAAYNTQHTGNLYFLMLKR